MAEAQAKELEQDSLEARHCDAAQPAWPVDLVHLAKYTLGDRDLEREVLQLFRCQARIYLERLHAAQDPRKMHDIAHTIKGSARSIGAWRVVECAEAVEVLIDSGSAKPAAPLLEALDAAVQEADGYIESLAGR